MATRRTRAQQDTQPAAADSGTPPVVGVMPPAGAQVGTGEDPGAQMALPDNQRDLTDEEVARVKAGENQRDIESGRNPGNVERGADNQERSIDPGPVGPSDAHGDFVLGVGPEADKGSQMADHNLASTYLDVSEMSQIESIPGEAKLWLPTLVDNLAQRAFAAGQKDAGFTQGKITSPTDGELNSAFNRGRAAGRKEMSPQE